MVSTRLCVPLVRLSHGLDEIIVSTRFYVTLMRLAHADLLILTNPEQLHHHKGL